MLFLQLLADYFYVSVILSMGGVLAFLIVQKERKHTKAKLKLEKSKNAGTDLPNSLHPVINHTKCGGCGACTAVCPEGDILQLIEGKAHLVNGSKCVGHGECQKACPFDAIDLVFGTLEKGVDIPNLSKDYETNVAGVYIIGELGGMGLIRNAIKQGSWASYHAIEKRTSRDQTDTDLFIVGAGPAGIAASLAAIEKKVPYICIDQNTIGGTVNNYPRNKIVMSYPGVLPIVGQMKFPGNKVSKEELIDFWKRAIEKSGLMIHENTKFMGFKRDGDHFIVETDKRTWTARKILLALGTGGLPMKLGLENEDSPKIFYSLKDPGAFTDKNIVVVGGGNSAVEAAQYLGAEKLQNKVKLFVRGKALSRTNEENQQIINEMARKGILEICYETSIKEIHPEHLLIDQKGSMKEIKNDYVFVFAGNIRPYKQLMELGVKIETKFGEKIGI